MYTIKHQTRWARYSHNNNSKQNILPVAVGIVLVTWVFSAPIRALADASTLLMHRVDRALRANDRLNGAMCYTAAPGVVVLYGKVFDEKDRNLAEVTASKVRGVKQVVNALRTITGQWQGEESRINDTLLLNGLDGVSARVIGSQVYLSGTVTTEAEKRRASRVVASISNFQQNNLIWVKPGPIF